MGFLTEAPSRRRISIEELIELMLTIFSEFYVVKVQLLSFLWVLWTRPNDFLGDSIAEFQREE